MPTTVFIGDSITRDWPLSFVAGARNSGVGGNRTLDMALRFWESALAFDPYRIVILGGHGDMRWDASPSVANIIGMVQRGKEAGASMYVGTLLPRADAAWAGYPHVASAAAGNQKLLAFNADIRAFATGYEFTVLDFHPGFVNANGTYKSELFLPDGLHLNSAGYAVLSAIAAPIISP